MLFANPEMKFFCSKLKIFYMVVVPNCKQVCTQADYLDK